MECVVRTGKFDVIGWRLAGVGENGAYAGLRSRDLHEGRKSARFAAVVSISATKSYSAREGRTVDAVDRGEGFDRLAAQPARLTHRTTQGDHGGQNQRLSRA